MYREPEKTGGIKEPEVEAKEFIEVPPDYGRGDVDSDGVVAATTTVTVLLPYAVYHMKPCACSSQVPKFQVALNGNYKIPLVGMGRAAVLVPLRPLRAVWDLRMGAVL